MHKGFLCFTYTPPVLYSTAWGLFFSFFSCVHWKINLETKHAGSQLKRNNMWLIFFLLFSTNIEANCSRGLKARLLKQESFQELLLRLSAWERVDFVTAYTFIENLAMHSWLRLTCLKPWKNICAQRYHSVHYTGSETTYREELNHLKELRI